MLKNLWLYWKNWIYKDIKQTPKLNQLFAPIALYFVPVCMFFIFTGLLVKIGILPNNWMGEIYMYLFYKIPPISKW